MTDEKNKPQMIQGKKNTKNPPKEVLLQHI